MKPLELNIIFEDLENFDYDDDIIVVKIEDCEVREMTFYSIDAIAKHYEGDENINKYCMIHSNGDNFICVSTYDEVKELIKNNL